ncbi:MAG: DUF2059 domain-containing protein [Humidesulfovibrio sp.]|uniref:DUF2059 domain-containing protein n=1 Tax=Humidesulfovibrio sp. TaxID=2910988 RepID=UPI0027EC3E89|nr:DUF2059 domain-containing protein [Humidesulfovibrio sp.]MDQ7836741.1 DUF2059 domain-containing protein [Humidesulfovibrio sp.]
MFARLALACILACLLGTTALADELTPAKQADIKLLLASSGGATVGKKMASIMTRQIVETLRRTRPDIPVHSLAIVEREVVKMFTETFDAPGGVVDRLVPLYASTFTHEEVRELLAFYQSPTGKKAVASLPRLMVEGQKIGQQLARDVAPELNRRIKEALKQEGVVLDKMP